MSSRESKKKEQRNLTNETKIQKRKGRERERDRKERERERVITRRE